MTCSKPAAAERLVAAAGTTNAPDPEGTMRRRFRELTQERDGLLVSLGMANKRLSGAKKADDSGADRSLDRPDPDPA